MSSESSPAAETAGSAKGDADAVAAPREVLTWETFGDAGRELAQLVADSGYRPDLILTIARGGLLPAGALGYALDVKNLVVVNVEFYVGMDQRLDVPVMLPPVTAG